MAAQTGEGTRDIIYHTTSVPAGPHTYGGYLSRPTYEGQWPTVLIVGPEPTPTSTVKDFCRILARHGIAAIAPDLTVSHAKNLRINLGVSSFLKDPTGHWSNAQLGYGVLSFGAGIYDLANLADEDVSVLAGAMIGATLDADVVALIRSRPKRNLAILSRGDGSTDVDASLAQRDKVPSTTFVVYPTGAKGFWDVSSEGFDEPRYTDVVDRLIGFFTEQLPARI